jgi:quercetin dioxygenase-like cupin family protein
MRQSNLVREIHPKEKVMNRKPIAQVEPVEMKHEGFEGMFARYLWTAVDGCPHYAMRIMEFEPGGHTSYHSHLEEHEFYFLEGEAAYVDGQGNQILVSPGDGIYCPPDEPHQIKNVGSTRMKMLCTIPILPGGDGKTPAPRPGA